MQVTQAAGGPQAGEPVKFTWEVPAAVKVLALPVEFTDLPLP